MKLGSHWRQVRRLEGESWQRWQLAMVQGGRAEEVMVEEEVMVVEVGVGVEVEVVVEVGMEVGVEVVVEVGAGCWERMGVTERVRRRRRMGKSCESMLWVVGVLCKE
jgi:hypothetical protein